MSGHSKLRSLETLNKSNLLSAVHIMKKFSLVFQHLFIEQCVAMRNNRFMRFNQHFNLVVKDLLSKTLKTVFFNSFKEKFSFYCHFYICYLGRAH